MATFSAYSDQQLLELVKNGDPDAYETLYRRHSPMMYRAAFYILRDEQACSDLVQDIFVWLWEKRRSLDISLLQPYLRTAVKFKVANLVRSGKIRDSFFEDLSRQPLEAGNSTEELIALSDLKLLVQQAIDALPARAREVFLLSREAHFSNREIAEQLGISVKAVEKQMTLSLRLIRAAIEPHLIELLLVSSAVGALHP
ncbi:RNA polymerase sigma-70 factor [Chitinophaga horti]|uniref:RNA polymerase sigma-70 factor n=1 Tax=Chitinophaga horti TaxID=2920382 RepID=A0ABY6J7D1_9BACT|nr:RNA polymerase sigma-70 factor [Chitinophaga horti]UYQ95502.1 RNA polymerase sigma-70 factor [Chitinophaga horti]